MKNRAFDLSVKYVVLETNQADSTTSGGAVKRSGRVSSHETDVTNLANAYKSPPNQIGLN
jgi:hypothetical protein